VFEQLYGVALNSQPVFVLTANSYLVKKKKKGGPRAGESEESLFLLSWLYKTSSDSKDSKEIIRFFFIIIAWHVGVCRS